MLLFFNEKTLDLTVQTGALSDYVPTPEIKEIVHEALLLKEKREEFYNKEFNPKMKKLLDRIDLINVTANPELKVLRDKKAIK